MSDLDGLLIGVPSLVVLVVTALLVFVTAARWVRAPRSLVLAAVAASAAFAVHNQHIGQELHGEYWGTFPGESLTSLEGQVLYATQALVFVGASGMVLAGFSRRASWWIVPVLWVGGWFGVMLSVYEASHDLARRFHWLWYALQRENAAKLWGLRLALAYAFIAFIGRERKATPEVEPTPAIEAPELAQRGDAPPSASRSVGKTSTERPAMRQAKLFAPVLVALVAIMAATLDRSAMRADQRKAEHEAARLDMAKRLRADGDRLASEGRWEDALARYDQAGWYDHAGEFEEETQQKLRTMKAHAGDVVFDKEFQDPGPSP